MSNELKRCSKCGEEKPLSAFGKDKHKKDGHRGSCKSCRATRVAESAKRYYRKHADRINAEKRQRLIDNPEYREAQNKARRDRRANDEEYANKLRARERRSQKERLKDPVKRQKQRDAVMRQYHKNKPAWRAAWAKYKAAKVSQTPSWANEQAIKAFYAEAKRLEELTGIKFHVDHIIPLQGELVSGLHVETNLQLLPANENIGKGNSFNPEAFVA